MNTTTITCHQVHAGDHDHLDRVRELFREYQDFLGAGHICTQEFDAEIASLPGDYARPGGALLLAVDSDGTPAGCVALRAITTINGIPTSELKRLWVRPDFRGHGVAQTLLTNTLDAARALGHKTIHLDTVPAHMQPAVKLYQRNGFVECPRYNKNLADYARFFSRAL